MMTHHDEESRASGSGAFPHRSWLARKSHSEVGAAFQGWPKVVRWWSGSDDKTWRFTPVTLPRFSTPFRRSFA